MSDADGAVALRVRFARGVVVLPRPHCNALWGRLIEGWPNEVALRFLRHWLPVGRERARQILQEGRDMLRETLRGADPRLRWPRRFARQRIVDNSAQPYPGLDLVRQWVDEELRRRARLRRGGSNGTTRKGTWSEARIRPGGSLAPPQALHAEALARGPSPPV